MTTWKRELTLAVFLANFLFFFGAVYWSWPEWWKQINYDRGARSWLFVVELSAISFASLQAFYLSRLEQKPFAGLWLILSLGFLFLSFDKGFQIHENMREMFFRPRGIGTRLPGIRPGDIMPLIYATLGLTLVGFMVKRLGFSRQEAGWLYSSVVLAVIAVAFDIANLPSQDYMLLRAAQFFEKMIQTGSLASLLTFVLRYNVDLLSQRHETTSRHFQRAG